MALPMSKHSPDPTAGVVTCWRPLIAGPPPLPPAAVRLAVLCGTSVSLDPTPRHARGRSDAHREERGCRFTRVMHRPSTSTRFLIPHCIIVFDLKYLYFVEYHASDEIKINILLYNCLKSCQPSEFWFS